MFVPPLFFVDNSSIGELPDDAKPYKTQYRKPFLFCQNEEFQKLRDALAVDRFEFELRRGVAKANLAISSLEKFRQDQTVTEQLETLREERDALKALLDPKTRIKAYNHLLKERSTHWLAIKSLRDEPDSKEKQEELDALERKINSAHRKLHGIDQLRGRLHQSDDRDLRCWRFISPADPQPT